MCVCVCGGGGGVWLYVCVCVCVCVAVCALNAFFYSMTTNVNIEGQNFALLLSNDHEYAEHSKIRLK